MKKAYIILLMLLLLIPSLVFPQTSRSRSAAATANRSWTQFWQQYSAAINKKDRTALRRMMSDNFSDGGGGGTASDWLKFMDQQNLWREHQKSVALGTKPYNYDRVPRRITKNDHLIFEFKDGRWWWWGIMGD